MSNSEQGLIMNNILVSNSEQGLIMNNIIELIGPIGLLIISIFFIVWAILWFLLPFAIFGVKSRLDRMIEELAKLNKKK